MTVIELVRILLDTDNMDAEIRLVNQNDSSQVEAIDNNDSDVGYSIGRASIDKTTTDDLVFILFAGEDPDENSGI